MSGIICQSKSGDYDMWIPKSPGYPESEQYQAFRIRRIELSDRYPSQCAACLQPMSHWDNPAVIKGRRDGKVLVASTSINIGIKVQRLDLKSIDQHRYPRPLHLMAWIVSPMTFQAQGCPACQMEYMRLVGKAGPEEAKQYRGRKSYASKPLTRKFCIQCKQTFLGARCQCGYQVEQASTGITWSQPKAFIDLTDEVMRCAAL